MQTLRAGNRLQMKYIKCLLRMDWHRSVDCTDGDDQV